MNQKSKSCFSYNTSIAMSVQFAGMATGGACLSGPGAELYR